MRGLLRRAAVVSGAAVVLGAGAGSVAASTGPMLAFTPAPYHYGSVTVGRAAVKTFTLANTGGLASPVLAGRVKGSAEFKITADGCGGIRLRPGKSCQVKVQFAPTSSGAVTATLRAVNKRTRKVLATDSLTGTGATASHLYWANRDDGTIHEANLNGTGATTLVTGQNGPVGVAVDGSHIYWANVFGGTIDEANLNGTGVRTLVTGQQGSAGVAVDSSHIYWTIFNDPGTIHEANLNGTGATTLVTRQSGPAGVAVGPQ